MQNDNEKKKIKKPSGMRTNFAFQAAVLAGAGILSRVIGLLYRSPLFQIIGDEGNGYYGTAYAIYSMILMIATYSIPTAVSKIISGKLALGEYRNARRVFKCAFYLCSICRIGGGCPDICICTGFGEGTAKCDFKLTDPRTDNISVGLSCYLQRLSSGI